MNIGAGKNGAGNERANAAAGPGGHRRLNESADGGIEQFIGQTPRVIADINDVLGLEARRELAGDLDAEVGTGSPDASAGVPKDHYSVEYRGDVRAPADGTYTFSARSDGQVTVAVDGHRVVGAGASSGSVHLAAHRTYPVTVRYAHGSGPSSLHLTWSGPGVEQQVLEPATPPAGL